MHGIASCNFLPYDFLTRLESCPPLLLRLRDTTRQIMTKLLVPVVLAITFVSTANMAQQPPGRSSLRGNLSVRPTSVTEQPGPSLDETMKWLQQRFPAPFDVDVKAGGHFSESVSYSTVLVDWKGCSAHFRSDREYNHNGENVKRSVEQTIPLGDVDPSRIQSYPLQVPGLLWDVPGINISTSYERRSILDTFQAPDQRSYYTNITFSDPSGQWEPRVITALQHAVEVCGGRPEIF
jgi:hypothetical protein